MNAKWTEKEIKLLNKEYATNQKVYDLFENRSINAINHKASRACLKRKMRKKIYTNNSTFFKTWSNKMAYVLGWFFSDGNVSKNTNCCSIHLAKRDFEMLEKIKRAMGSNHKIFIDDNSVNLRIYDYILHSSLIKLGCVPKKSLICKFPKVPKAYLSHFIRGYFDGDGSISFNKPNTIKIYFLGTKDFINQLQTILNQNLDIKINEPYPISNIYRISYYGNNARKICKWMYNNNNGLYLKRKKNRFDNHMRIGGKWK